MSNKSKNKSWNTTKTNDSWSLFKIMGEFVQGFEIEIKDEPSDLNYSFKFIKEKKNGKLFTYSSDAGFMNIITDIKEEKRKSKNFSFTDGDEGKMYEMMILKKIK